MEPAFIILHGTVLITIQDPGHGDSTSHILHILGGDLAGDIVRAGSVSDLVMDMDMVLTGTDMAVADMAGGDPLSTIPHVGVVGMVVQDLMDSMEIISMCIIMYT